MLETGIAAGLFLAVIAVFVVSARYHRFRRDRLGTLVAASRIAETGAGPIEYTLQGTDGPTVLFLHGTPGGYDQAPEVPGYRVLGPSRPGYLRTPLSVGAAPDQQARACVALLDALDIDRVIVMGASGGGPIAISFAAMYPERSLALVAMEAVSQQRPVDVVKPLSYGADFWHWLMVTLMLRLLGFARVLRMMVPDPANQRRILEDEARADDLRHLMMSGWPVSHRHEGTRNDQAQFEKLALPSERIAVPTLIIHGTADTNVPFDQSRALASQIPGAELYAIEGADHWMPYSHGDEVSAALEAFAERHGLAGSTT